MLASNDPPQTLLDVFARTVAQYPSRIALEFASRKTTYHELDILSTQLAKHLLACGVTPGSCVGLYHSRSDRCLIAILAILKAGCAYVPIDPATPVERVRNILEDCQASALISDSPSQRQLDGFTLPIIWLQSWSPEPVDEKSLPDVKANDLAYLIYTSGSTGKPKGVMIEHQSVCHYVSVQKDLYGVTENDRVFQSFSLAFDASVEEIWLALAHGATLVVGSDDLMQKGPELGYALEALGITVLSTVPTLLTLLEGELKGVRILILGGEACTPALVNRWSHPSRKLFNTYGPTEATVIATAKICEPNKPVTIGKPLRGYEVILVDNLGTKIFPSQIGDVGEIWIGGVAVARGYLNREELTEDKFRNVAWGQHGTPMRYYCTGDLGSWNATGELEFRGRIDQQVKIRGFRIELEEVEAALQNLTHVQASAVKVFHNENTGPYLVGYAILSQNLTEHDLRERLRMWLPAYMVPSRFVFLDEFPLLPSGKVDRNRLPEPEIAKHSADGSQVWANETQRKLGECWSRVLGVARIHAEQHFFHDLGGHSLLVAQVVSEMRKVEGFATLSVADIYHHSTIAQLAAKLDSQTTLTQTQTEAPTRKPISKIRHFLCGCGQFLALYPLLGFFSLQWMLPYLVYSDFMYSGYDAEIAIGLALLSLLGVFPVMLIICILSKWLVIGRYKPGRYPLWGLTYFRFWFVRSLCGMAPTNFLVGTPLLCWYYRLMGAKIGKNVYLGTDDLACYDLVEIGDNSSIGYGAGLHAYTVAKGELHLGKIRIGEDAFVGSRSLLEPGSRTENQSALEDLSLLQHGQTIPTGERWLGSPAQKIGAYNSNPQTDIKPSPMRLIFLNLLYGLGSLFLPLVAIVAYFPGVLFLSDQARHSTGYGYLLYAPLVALSFVLIFTLLVTVAKWLLLGRVRAGTYPRHSFFSVRRWFVNGLMDLSLDVTGTLYATIYLNPWYRALGVKVGKRAEISTADSIPFDLLELGPESFLADAVTVGAARVERDTVILDKVTIGEKAFAGNGAVIPPGRTLGADGLLGCLSLAPVKASVPDSSWVGSPAVFLPVRQESKQFSEAQISKPPLKLWVLRGAIEAVRVLLPPTVLVVMSSFLINVVMVLREELAIVEILALFPLIYLVAGASTVLLTLLAKWLIIGKWKSTQQPLWSHFVWRTELISGLREHLADRYLAGLLVGTPFIAWYYRLLGAKIGKRVFLDTNDLCEFDLTVIGDEAEINEWATLQTHLFEDRVMKVSWVKIGAGATVGGRTLILYDTEIEPHAHIGELSLIMKGETIPAGNYWRGIPVSVSG